MENLLVWPYCMRIFQVGIVLLLQLVPINRVLGGILNQFYLLLQQLPHFLMTWFVEIEVFGWGDNYPYASVQLYRYIYGQVEGGTVKFLSQWF